MECHLGIVFFKYFIMSFFKFSWLLRNSSRWDIKTQRPIRSDTQFLSLSSFFLDHYNDLILAMTLVGGHVWVCLLTLACSAGVLLDISSSRSFIRPAIFDVELVPSLHRNKLGGGLFWRRFSFFYRICICKTTQRISEKGTAYLSCVKVTHMWV